MADEKKVVELLEGILKELKEIKDYLSPERRQMPGLQDIKEICESGYEGEANEMLGKGWVLLNTLVYREPGTLGRTEKVWYILGRPEGLEPEKPQEPSELEKLQDRFDEFLGDE